jgi:hypothetical protein
MFVSLLTPPLAVSDPLYAKNLSPASGLFGFPNLREAGTLEAGVFQAALQGSVANTYSIDDNAREDLNFDVETRRLAFRAAVGLGSGWELEAEVPWLRHEGGDLDEIIEDWHDFFNLPNGNRDKAPRDLIDVRYAGPGANFALQEEADGWGDVSLAVVRRLWRSEHAAISARLGAKLGSGDEDDLLGSGGDDYYLSLNFSGNHRTDLPIRWHGQVGYLRAGDSDVLGDAQEQDLWFAGGGMEWRAWQTFHLKLQIDSHAAVMDSSLSQTGDTSVQLTAGASWLFARGWEAEFSFSEDIAVETAPDFVLQFGLRYRTPAD